MKDHILEYIEMLEEDMGKVKLSVSIDEEKFKKYQDILPSALMLFWKKLGWGCFGEGLYWLVNPGNYNNLMDIWLEGTPFKEIDYYHVLARDAFGNLYVWGQNNNQSFTISCSMYALIAHEKKIKTLSDNPNIGISIFLSKQKKYLDIKDENSKPLFDRALKKLGPLASDEMYGFEQPLFAGGRMMLDNLVKVKLDQHLTLLRQMGGKPKIPFADINVDV